VAVRRAQAELKLAQSASEVAHQLGITFRSATVPRNRYPDLYAAELLERIDDLLLQIKQTRTP
jgi:hypothetical protein